MESFDIIRPTLNIYLIIILLKMLLSHTLCFHIVALAYLNCKTEGIVIKAHFSHATENVSAYTVHIH